MSEPMVRELLARGDAFAVLLHDPNRDEIVLVEELRHIGKYYNSAGGSTETTTVFYVQIDASNVEGVHGVDVENEDIFLV